MIGPHHNWQRHVCVLDPCRGKKIHHDVVMWRNTLVLWYTKWNVICDRTLHKNQFNVEIVRDIYDYIGLPHAVSLPPGEGLAFFRFYVPESLTILFKFLPTCSCNSLPRPTTSSGWQLRTCVSFENKHLQILMFKPRGHIILIKTHHYIIFIVRPLHSKPGMESYCWSGADQLSW